MIRYYCALLLGKLSKTALKVFGKRVPYYPGYVALKVCPDFLKYAKKPPVIIAVTGTNGKSTISALLDDAFTSKGLYVINNDGFNIETGIAAMFVNQKGLADIAILEVDEKTTGAILEHITPNYLICTNLFRDSMNGNSSVDFITDRIISGTPKETTMIINADDLLAVRIGEGRENIYFGISDRLNEEIPEHRIIDLVYCPRCGGKIEYIDTKNYHIGNAVCKSCGYTNPKRDYDAHPDYDNKTIRIDHKGKEYVFPLNFTSIHNTYNYIAAISLMLELGYDSDWITDAMGKLKITETRYTETVVNGVSVQAIMSKGQNPVATSSVLTYVNKLDGNKAVLLMIGDVTDNRYSSETIAWYYDTDFELLNDNSVKQVIISGKRSEDLYVRLLLAGVDADIITRVEEETEMASKLINTGIDKILLLYDLTYYDHSIGVKDQIIKEAQKW